MEQEVIPCSSEQKVIPLEQEVILLEQKVIPLEQEVIPCLFDTYQEPDLATGRHPKELNAAAMYTNPMCFT